MAYSLAVNFANKNRQAAVLAFCQKHYRPWTVIYPREGAKQYASNPRADLGYTHLKYPVGIDYNAALGEREYAFCFIRWLARKVGKKGYYYDFEILPLNDEKVDSLGIPLAWAAKDPADFLFMLIAKGEYEQEAIDAIVAEIKRLDDLWNADPPLKGKS